MKIVGFAIYFDIINISSLAANNSTRLSLDIIYIYIIYVYIYIFYIVRIRIFHFVENNYRANEPKNMNKFFKLDFYEPIEAYRSKFIHTEKYFLNLVNPNKI